MSRVALLILVVSVCPSLAYAGPPELSGQWSGYWVSDKNGHTGPLHGKFTQLDCETYRVRYHGRFAKVIPFWYTTKMHVTGAFDDSLVLTASQNLGPFLGTFKTTAVATPSSFEAQFSSRGDSGRFVLTRQR